MSILPGKKCLKKNLMSYAITFGCFSFHCIPKLLSLLASTYYNWPVYFLREESITWCYCCIVMLAVEPREINSLLAYFEYPTLLIGYVNKMPLESTIYSHRKQPYNNAVML